MKKINDIISSVNSALTVEDCQYPTINVPVEQLKNVAKKLFENGYDFLLNLTGMDYKDSLGVIYHISSSVDKNAMVVLKTTTDNRDNPVIPTVSDIWESANLYEREVYDFFGIRFINHPDMRRIFLRQDWNGYPFRKDYDSNPELNPVPLENQTIEAMEDVPTLTVNKDGDLVANR